MTIPKKYRALGQLISLLCICNFAFMKTGGILKLGVLLLAYAGLYFIYRYASLNRKDIGLARDHVKTGLIYGAVVCAIILSALLIVFALDSHAFRDPRYHESIWRAITISMSGELFKVVLFEELAFRGLLLTLLKDASLSTKSAVIISSVCFGLWHVTSSASIGNYRVGSGIIVHQSITMLSAVLFTSVAGVLLCALRFRSKSLTAPILVHWFVNSSAMILAAISWL